MTKFAAYTGYAVAVSLNFVQKRLFKLSIMASVVFALWLAYRVAIGMNIVEHRFMDFTMWFFKYTNAQGTPG